MEIEFIAQLKFFPKIESFHLKIKSQYHNQAFEQAEINLFSAKSKEFSLEITKS